MTPQKILQQYWQHNSFRGNQEAIINAVLEGKDTLALLPTGGGKSICFQVPGMMIEGLCIVISPLIALMKDQVENLLKRDIPAASLTSSLTTAEVIGILEDAAAGMYKFLYLSPERLETNLFQEYLPTLDCSLIAVDEAHCVSQWGYDFRPPYLRIANIRKQLGHVPLIALTASATPLVQDDIIAKLQLKDAAVFRQSFERANLSYSAFLVDSKINKAIEILTNVPGSSIVYCRNRSQTQQVAHLLALQNISADFYHAGLLQDDRAAKQQSWIENKTRVIVCTNAFGMGIDKPEVRTVIHFDTPECLESYYQEAGRAGRDGNKSYAVILYNFKDLEALAALPATRFPSMDEISKVYQALADFLGLPVGIGEGNYYDFDIVAFIKNFQLNAQLVTATLKVLEQEGHIAFNESVFLPAKVQFTAPKSLLEDFEESQPRLEPLVKCLLRNYSGIYDNAVSISEKKIARILRSTEPIVKELLLQLQAFGIIYYLPQKQTPQLHFILNRAPAKHLYINQQAYAERKKLFQERIDKILAFIHLKKECRGQFIAAYFGDSDAKACGICDNCLHLKQKPITRDDVVSIHEQIHTYIQTGIPTVKGLLESMPTIAKNKIWEVLQLLQDTGEIKIDDRGKIKS
ncbi:ATP-dependent DNA helicase RecQ [Parasediminibacterium sp. JCM 36343]|uniref:RecQ family ATP-dependent DNA helicase n=1 Tax=Parasediminibacterium sp. JCM 36343 TaxID=3374279 RepID=UPI003979FAC7